MVKITVNTITLTRPTLENRFGVSLAHANKFIAAFKNHKVNGFNVCNKYALTNKTASVHAHTFLWNVLDYKVIPFNKENQQSKSHLGFETSRS